MTFDPTHDKLHDQPVTIGGDKSAATWHGADTDLSILDKVTASYDEALREARAERDALAHSVERLTHLALRPRRWPEDRQVEVDRVINTAPAVSLALHDAEVKAQALDEAAVQARKQWEPYTCPWVGFLDDRAAAIRAEATS